MQRIYDTQKGPIEKKWHACLRFAMKLLVHKRANLTLVFLILVLSIIFCICSVDWEYISRSGSLITVVGIICMERRNLRLGPDIVFHFNRSALDNDETVFTEQLRNQEISNMYEDISSSYWGFVLTIIGTVLWGYGDELFQLFYPLTTV